MSIYIFGHKNPDTDSVCASITLANLKNKLGIKAEPKVLGNINNETKFILDYFNVDEPNYLNDVKVRIKNINYDKKAIVNENKSINVAFNLMKKENVTAIPLVNQDKILTGYVTLKEIAKYLINGNQNNINTTFENIKETLNAKVICQYDDIIEGKILIAGMNKEEFINKVALTKNDILIVGDRYTILDYALSTPVKLIIMPLNSKINKELLKKAKENKVNIIETDLDSYGIASKIRLSNYIKSINENKNPITFNNEDYYSDFMQMTHKVNHTNYPVVNNNNECLGLIRLTGSKTYDKQDVILVDHNNFEQSVVGIEEADIIEIIDHHNLGAIGTKMPINFTSKPVGSTCTIICEMYEEEKIKINKKIAGLLLSGLLSDTLVLNSPTTTEKDKNTAKKLAKIAGVKIEKYGYEMLEAASSIKDKTVLEIITSDFKKYNIDDKLLGIGQVMTMDINDILDNIDEYVKTLNKMAKDNYDLVALFVTDIIKQGSYVIYSTDSELIIASSFGIKKIKQGIFLPKILSRKKQILPNILSVIESDKI